MRLSEHGKDMLAAFGFAHQCDEAFDLLDDYEFSPEYFTGAVVLTAEEAVEILDYLSYLDMRGYRDSFLEGLTDCCKNLYDKIEQAEKSHGT